MALSNLYIFKYNTYFNRIVKKEDSLEDYGEPIFVLTNANFNMADGIRTTHIMGKTTYTGEGDYLIETDSEDNIKSRWFILDANFNRQGQWVIDLKRDVIAEHYDDIITSPAFIEKGFVNRKSKFIFNNENIVVNQIKQNQTTLRDESGVAWIVGYTSKSLGQKTISYARQSSEYDIYAGTIAANTWQYWQYQNTNYSVLSSSKVSMEMAIYGSLVVPWHAKINLTDKTYYHSGNNGDVSNCFTLNVRGTDWSNNHYDQLVNKIWDFYNMNDVNAVASAASTFPTNRLEDLMAYDNKVIQFSDGLYKCRVFKSSSSEMEENVAAPNELLINSIYNGYYNWSQYTRPDKSNFRTYSVIGKIDNYRITMEKLSSETITVAFPTTKFKTTDSAYDLFAIPFDTTRVFDEEQTFYFNSLGKDDIMGIVNAITQGLGNTELYDIQLLPYCPIPSVPDLYRAGIYGYSGVNIDNAGGAEHYAYEYIKDSNNNNVSIIFFPTRSAFTTKVYHYMNAVEPTGETTIDFKVKDICNMYRLTGGNHANSFEFNPTRTGEITWFKVSATYIPFQPYIRLCPEFTSAFGGYLYGPWMEDSRGLILNGDFSLSQINDAWIDYQVQNKNYNNIFARQIQNMEVNRNIQKTQEWSQAIVGTLQGTATGAAAGGSVGGMYGAIAGAAVGAVGSAVGGGFDIANNERLYQENLAFTKDMFGYQLGNIKALPNSLDKVSAYNIDNLVFPVVEYYTCSDEEKDAVRTKLIYEGYTIGVVDVINKYIKPDSELVYPKGIFVKAQLLHLDINDNHTTEDITRELMKGVYF